MTTESDIKTFLENAIWDKTLDDVDDKILFYEILTLEEAGVLSDAKRIGVIAGMIYNDNCFVVIATDRSTFVVAIPREM
ncbi:hypothetical protein [Methanococcoides burtonii]|uniref:Uncharacterized protein n=1 Tax=Methanococcoides burtonii (strain DSM 6242 / NBRC 107633 / OCM 468 / ACE-M) TaxID=259564 RepID=Q12X25_METBU|nr:hypothetical protein [Methanococcoides burtonii]ABE52001.1 Hypothetical protein Mbur_1071 [Methanococcoides burtonii DSM 6242]